MMKSDRRRCEMLARVCEVSTNYPHLLPDSSDARQALATIQSALHEAQACDDVVASASLAVARKALARQSLVDLLTRVAQTARVLSAGRPEPAPQFNLSKRVPDRGLVRMARQLLGEVASQTAKFVGHGLPATLVADLEQLIARFEATLQQHGATREERVAARARTAASLTAAMAAARTLDVIVGNHLVSDPVTRAVWRRERRIAYPRQNGQDEATPATGAATDGEAIRDGEAA